MSSDLQSTTSEFAATTQAELCRFLADNAAGERRALLPVGGRTSLHYGNVSLKAETILATSGLTRVVDYPARDMTITVEAGIRLDDLRTLLKSEGQQLPIDIAQSQRAALGGAAATDTGGSRRLGYGTFRDYVIGLSAATADGKLFHSGGRVVKNVAGYDMCKLLVGSMGTLAVITQLTLKLRPIPEKSAQLWAAYRSFSDLDRALESMLRSAIRPVALDVLNPQAAEQISAAARCDLPNRSPVLIVGVEGSAREVEWQIDTLRRELGHIPPESTSVFDGAEVSRLWSALTEYQCSADDPLTFQAHLLPSRAMEFAEKATSLGVAVQVHAGTGTVIGHLPDDAATVERAEAIVSPLRNLAHNGRGNLVILDCDNLWKPQLSVFGPPTSQQGLMRRIKSAFDPDDLLNSGRFFAP
ncbi:MAG: FAD-binding oxidoreductase [Planctomycetaceae bacterium]